MKKSKHTTDHTGENIFQHKKPIKITVYEGKTIQIYAIQCIVLK